MIEENNLLVIAEEEYSLHKALDLLPNQVKRVHGCLGCEWKRKKDSRNEPLCPHNLTKKTDMIKRGICPRRALYLALFSKDPQNIKSYTEWQREYNNSIAQRENMYDVMNLELLKDKLDIAEQSYTEAKLSEDTDKIKLTKKEYTETKTDYAYARKQWEDLHDKMMKHTDKKLDRETARKLDLNVNTMRLEDIHRIMRGDDMKIIEGEVVEDDND